MNFKKIITTTGIVVALLHTGTVQAAGGSFTDVPKGHWSEASIEYLTNKGFVSGYGNGKYGFGDYVTRGQVTAILSRYLNLEANLEETTEFTDIQGHMFEKDILAVTQSYIMRGDGTANFRPNDPVSRYEIAVILDKLFSFSLKEIHKFDDILEDHWARWSVNRLHSNGIISGIGNNQYGGDQYVTREQFAKFFHSSILGNSLEDITFVHPQLESLAKTLQNDGYHARVTEGVVVFNWKDSYNVSVSRTDEKEVSIRTNTYYEDDSSFSEHFKYIFNQLQSHGLQFHVEETKNAILDAEIMYGVIYEDEYVKVTEAGGSVIIIFKK
ncbi:S-layer homology domain-containing protein [Bacillus manliponensis]|uniref:S-layer homology domain-containing protein n=1 Tax=Bacillus manliponensis TaxID=574376 RepID=UPI003517D899